MRTIQVSGTNLFAVAAAELGDATQWYRIAAINGLTDPMLYGVTTLLLPEMDSTLGGGVPTQ
ncbi:hypothetical protein NFI95_04950 [Acetobacteraceae bacterium KSS8]|uniref:LysM domain-containing protein n=1 Tax=Endosaccharibacter trunci TaxID=2812733 RepID=A0ABT1W4I3_9PROT|nr:hypothetical protein [Acetobacteraceae bacterium KSS8]